MNGFHRGLEQEPAENKDSYGESNLPCPRRLWPPPNQGQRQRPHRADCDDNKRFSEIPWNLFFCKAWGWWRHPETHRSVYTLSRRLEYLQRRRDTFSLLSLLVERLKSAGRVTVSIRFIVIQLFHSIPQSLVLIPLELLWQ